MKSLKSFMMAALSMAISLLVAAQTLAQNDRIRGTPVGWSWAYGIGSATIDAQLAGGLRPIAMQRIAPGSYDTVFVSNTGSYAVANSDVFFSVTEFELTSALVLGGKRLLDLEAFDIGFGPRFNAIVVPNSGSTIATGWQWVHDKTFGGIVAWLNANPSLRLIDIDYYETNGTSRYSGVAVPNTGQNFQAGTWYGAGATEEQIEDALQLNNARLIDIEVINPGGNTQATTYAFIMIPKGNVRCDWFPRVPSSQIPALIEQYGSRIVCLERYEPSFGTRYSVVLVNNADAQTARVRDYITGNTGEDGGIFSNSNFVGGAMGFMLKEVGGPVITTINPDFVWEPASTCKLLHAAYAIWQCSIGFDSLQANVQYRNLISTATPDIGCTSCPFDWICDPKFISLENSIRLLLEPSNNNALIALERRYNVWDINNFADVRGFGGINLIRQDCQCAVTLNTATCTDICEMMEQVADGSIFNQTWQDKFYSLMFDLEEQGYGYYPVLSTIINQEAASTNLTSGEIAAFREAMRFANKGGSYDCGEVYRTEGGWASIPFKFFAFDTWITYEREYTFAVFIHDSNSSQGSNIVYNAKQEILREQIREALQSWDDACLPPFVFNQPDSISRQAGETAEFSVVIAAGGDGETIRWQKRIVAEIWQNLNNSLGNVAGATTETLRLFNVDAADAGNYRAVYTSVCGSTTSNSATLTVTAPPPDCLGDANDDGIVNFADITSILLYFNTSYSPGTGPGDGDRDGEVNFSDITSTLLHWNSVCK